MSRLTRGRAPQLVRAGGAAERCTTWSVVSACIGARVVRPSRGRADRSAPCTRDRRSLRRGRCVPFVQQRGPDRLQSVAFVGRKQRIEREQLRLEDRHETVHVRRDRRVGPGSAHRSWPRWCARRSTRSSRTDQTRAHGVDPILGDLHQGLNRSWRSKFSSWSVFNTGGSLASVELSVTAAPSRASPSAHGRSPRLSSIGFGISSAVRRERPPQKPYDHCFTLDA